MNARPVGFCDVNFSVSPLRSESEGTICANRPRTRYPSAPRPHATSASLLSPLTPENENSPRNGPTSASQTLDTTSNNPPSSCGLSATMNAPIARTTENTKPNAPSTTARVGTKLDGESSSVRPLVGLGPDAIEQRLLGLPRGLDDVIVVSCLCRRRSALGCSRGLGFLALGLGGNRGLGFLVLGLGGSRFLTLGGSPGLCFLVLGLGGSLRRSLRGSGLLTLLLACCSDLGLLGLACLGGLTLCLCGVFLGLACLALALLCVLVVLLELGRHCDRTLGDVAVVDDRLGRPSVFSLRAARAASRASRLAWVSVSPFELGGGLGLGLIGLGSAALTSSSPSSADVVRLAGLPTWPPGRRSVFVTGRPWRPPSPRARAALASTLACSRAARSASLASA